MSRPKRLRQFRPERSASKPTYTAELTISSLGHDGRGIGRHQGKVVFVENALPGERVLVKVQKVGRRFDEGITLEHLVVSEFRSDPVCTHFDRCGGCQLQHLVYDQQLVYKRERLHSLLNALGAAQVRPEVLSGSPWQYRHRVRLAFAQTRSGVSLGFRERRSHRVVPLEECPVLQTPLLEAVLAARESLSEFLAPLKSGEVVFCLGGKGAVGVAIYSGKTATQTACAALSVYLYELGMTLFSVHNQNGIVWQNERASALHYEGISEGFSFVPGDFTQANPEINRLMQKKVLEWLDLKPEDGVVDFFCGLGNFSLPLARSGAAVFGFESDIRMVQRASQTASEAGLAELNFSAVDLFQTFPQLDERINKALLDPPRAGAQALCTKLAACRQIQTVVYVSCDPGSLERDLQLLQAGGFVIQQAALADMFPHTRHLESLIMMER